MNFKNPKIPNVPTRGATTTLKVALFGGTAVYAALNSLYNVDGGHRAIVFNLIDGIKDKHEKRAVWGYMKNLQSDLTPKMRAMLVDWMVQVCDGFSFCSDTLYLAVYLLDRFLAKSKLEREELVVLGTSCILIASKYEERRRPTSTVAQLFTHTKCTKAEAQPNLELVARYLAELTLLDYNFLRYLPSEIAASAVFLARWALDPSSHPWGEAKSIELIGKAMSSDPSFLALRQIEAAREISHTIADPSLLGSVKLTKKNVATPDNKFTADTRIGTSATILSLLKAWLANVYLIC
ncbi:Cyclin-A2-2 [Carex littledalei]|uniref:Cyclin-A2-2 n=1 Tax=Carex littledalei TaxID=544730 RepID=A0A833QK62_9POAL|nr:Cyclin-A2-2 [Carex littledalei]